MKKSNYQFNAKIENYFKWSYLFSGLLLILAGITLILDTVSGLVVLTFFFLSILISIGLTVFSKKKLIHEVINFSLQFGEVQKDFLYEFPIPYFLIGQDGRIKWCNAKFKALFQEEKVLDKTIDSIVPNITMDQLPKKGDGPFNYHIQMDDQFYNVEIQYLELQSTNKEHIYMYGAYLFDETLINELRKKNKEQKVVMGLFYIDNYEEALESIEDVRRPLLVALIDRNISKFAQSIDGVVRKFEKDKYFFIFQQKYLAQLQSGKFSILDDIREINIGNEMAVTLSMGLGVNGKTFQQNIEYARIAIDLALGRGGDQAVVKDVDKLYYYGGKTKVVEKSTRVKARVKAHAFRELIEAKDKVIIMGHKLQDLDSLGAAIGIYRGAKTLNKKAYIVLNEVTTSVRQIYDMFIQDEDYEKDMFLNNDEAIEKADETSLLVVVDVNRPSYTECPELLKLIPNIVVFDHHRASSEYIDNAVLSYVEPYASSTCEMVSEILQYMLDKVRLKPLEADALFAGMTVDTKNFMVKTGVKTFEAAAFLRRNGADVVRVRKLFRNDLVSYKAKANAIQNAQIYRDFFAITVCPAEGLESPTVVTAQTADELLNITGMKASFVLTQIEEVIYISARSIDEINVQLIMEKLGGGGHLNVAGAQLINHSLEEAKELLKEKIDELIEEGE